MMTLITKTATTGIIEHLLPQAALIAPIDTVTIALRSVIHRVVCGVSIPRPWLLLFPVWVNSSLRNLTPLSPSATWRMWQPLGGSWDLASKVRSTLIGVISIVTLIITLVTTSHDP